MLKSEERAIVSTPRAGFLVFLLPTTNGLLGGSHACPFGQSIVFLETLNGLIFHTSRSGSFFSRNAKFIKFGILHQGSMQFAFAFGVLPFEDPFDCEFVSLDVLNEES